MPCDSNVVRTAMTKHDQLVKALENDGWTVTASDTKRVVANRNGAGIMFSRYNEKDAFSTTSNDLEAVRSVQRKYAEVGVRAFASKNKYAIASVEEVGNVKKMVLKNRSK